MGRQFEFRATFSELDEGLDVLHRSVERLRRATGRGPDDRELMLFETALGEIGSNVLTHGRPSGLRPVDYALRLEGAKVVASLSDWGPPVHEHLAREMPAVESEDGRGLAMARSLLDELGYEREGDRNHWLLVKRL
ncbi:MAG TPA: ATP-binding protein [Candidatus Dormibacteraeota bacterium]|nr:ATP-binding protein [Candidatus Dormibacteraeota bacterium]